MEFSITQSDGRSVAGAPRKTLRGRQPDRLHTAHSRTLRAKISSNKKKIRLVFKRMRTSAAKVGGQLVFERLKENSIAFPGGSSQWFIALLPGRVCRVGTAAIWGEKNDMLLGKGFYRAQERPGEKTKRLRPRLALFSLIENTTRYYSSFYFLFNSILLNGL